MNFTITNTTNNIVYFAEGNVPPNGTLVVNYVTKSMENAENEGTISISPARIGDSDITMSDDIAYSGGGTAVVAGTAAAATGSIELADLDNVADGETLTINGWVITFVDDLTGADWEVEVGTDNADSLANLLTFLQASEHPAINVATYAAGTDAIDITYNTTGEIGNAFAMETDSADLTVDTNLSGGLNAYNVPVLDSVHSTVSVAIATAFRELALFRTEISKKMNMLISMRQGSRPL